MTIVVTSYLPIKDVFFTMVNDIVSPIKCRNVLVYLRLEKLSDFMYWFVCVCVFFPLFFFFGDICVYLTRFCFFWSCWYFGLVNICGVQYYIEREYNVYCLSVCCLMNLSSYHMLWRHRRKTLPFFQFYSKNCKLNYF